MDVKILVYIYVKHRIDFFSYELTQMRLVSQTIPKANENLNNEKVILPGKVTKKSSKTIRYGVGLCQCYYLTSCF